MWLDSHTQWYQRAKPESVFRSRLRTRTRTLIGAWKLSSRRAESTASSPERDGWGAGTGPDQQTTCSHTAGHLSLRHSVWQTQKEVLVYVYRSIENKPCIFPGFWIKSDFCWRLYFKTKGLIIPHVLYYILERKCCSLIHKLGFLSDCQSIKSVTLTNNVAL